MHQNFHKSHCCHQPNFAAPTELLRYHRVLHGLSSCVNMQDLVSRGGVFPASTSRHSSDESLCTIDHSMGLSTYSSRVYPKKPVSFYMCLKPIQNIKFRSLKCHLAKILCMLIFSPNFPTALEVPVSSTAFRKECGRWVPNGLFSNVLRCSFSSLSRSGEETLPAALVTFDTCFKVINASELPQVSLLSSARHSFVSRRSHLV